MRAAGESGGQAKIGLPLSARRLWRCNQSGHAIAIDFRANRLARQIAFTPEIDTDVFIAIRMKNVSVGPIVDCVDKARWGLGWNRGRRFPSPMADNARAMTLAVSQFHANEPRRTAQGEQAFRRWTVPVIKLSPEAVDFVELEVTRAGRLRLTVRNE